MALKNSGNAASKIAPKMTPGIWPIPPNTTMAKTTIDSDKEKDSGDINPWKEANKAPEMPPNDAPMANASNFKLRVFSPIA